MGAYSFIEFGEGATAREAFNKLYEEAEYWYGHDPYNGTISTTELVGNNITVAEEWSDAARDMAYGVADADDYGNKWESRAIDCGKCGDGVHMWAFYGWAAV